MNVPPAPITRLVPLGSAAAEVTTSEPPLTVVGPVYELVPASSSAAGPCITNPPPVRVDVMVAATLAVIAVAVPSWMVPPLSV